ncbi:nucleotidyltransferase domain-containing protein [Bdellovibrionota bacterium FG-1]
MTWTAHALKTVSIDQRLALLPKPLVVLVAEAVKCFAPRQIFLFGSRARGDAKSRSDFDLAFDFPAAATQGWAQFLAWMDQDPPSLHRYDLIDLAQADSKLKQNIQVEGLVIYEKHPT